MRGRLAIERAAACIGEGVVDDRQPACIDVRGLCTRRLRDHPDSDDVARRGVSLCVAHGIERRWQTQSEHRRRGRPRTRVEHGGRHRDAVRGLRARRAGRRRESDRFIGDAVGTYRAEGRRDRLLVSRRNHDGGLARHARRPARRAAWRMRHHGTLAYYEESAGGTVGVLDQGADAQRFRRLYIQGPVQFRRCDDVAALYASAGTCAAHRAWRYAAFGARHRAGHGHHGGRALDVAATRQARGRGAAACGRASMATLASAPIRASISVPSMAAANCSRGSSAMTSSRSNCRRLPLRASSICIRRTFTSSRRSA